MSNKRKIGIISSISKKNYDDDYYLFRNKLNDKFIRKNLPDVSEKEEFKSNEKEINKLEKEIENLKEDNKRLLKNQKKIFDKLYKISEVQEEILEFCKKILYSVDKEEPEIETGISKLNLNSECSYIC
jgi:predicted transcriptional regulator